MNWQNDLEIAADLEAARARGRLIRSVALWGPVFAVTASALVFFFIDRLAMGGDHGGTWFLVGFLALLSFLFGFQAAQAVLDLSGGLQEATGTVTRRWSRSDSLVMRSHYIRLDNKRILRIGAEFHTGIREGDHLRVKFYPHSALVVWAERVTPQKPPGDPATAPETI